MSNSHFVLKQLYIEIFKYDRSGGKNKLEADIFTIVMQEWALAPGNFSEYLFTDTIVSVIAVYTPDYGAEGGYIVFNI